ncbi:MAG: hypothetical protein ACOCOG_04115 [Prevotella sp.]
MLKHIYSIPSIKVMSVDTEDILTTWSGASQAKDSGNGTAALVPGDMTDDTKKTGSVNDAEGQGAKGISFDFE